MVCYVSIKMLFEVNKFVFGSWLFNDAVGISVYDRINEYGAVGSMRIGRGNRSIGRKIRPTTKPYLGSNSRTAVGHRPLTA
jgi:hypothetical protein